MIDYHPWCWKAEKDKDGGAIDKDYLSKWCKTPDCNAPTSKIEVFKEGGGDPVVITDKAITEKMLKEMQQIVKTQLVINQPLALEDMIAKEDEMQQKIDELTKQLQESKTVEKNLNRQLRASQRELEDSQAFAKSLQEVTIYTIQSIIHFPIIFFPRKTPSFRMTSNKKRRQQH